MCGRMLGDVTSVGLADGVPLPRGLTRLGFSLAATLDAPPLPTYWALTRPARPRK